MLKRIIGGTLAAALAGTIGFAAFLASAGAAVHGPAAGSPYGITLTAAGGTAGWAPDSNHPGVLLSVTSAVTPAPYGGYAQIVLHGFTPGAAMPTTEPSFTATGYASGTPRIEIVPDGPDSVANDVTGYPYSKASPACGTPTAGGMCWSVPDAADPEANDSTYAQVRAYIDSSGGVRSVYIVADASQPVPYTSDVTAFQWDAAQLIPGTVANSLTAADVCGSYAARHWSVTSVAGTQVRFTTHLRLNSGRWVRGPYEVAGGGGSVAFVTHRGGEIKLGYPDGLGHWKFSLFPAAFRACTA